VSRTAEGLLHRYTYRDVARRSRQLANALRSLGVQEEDRIATVAWNTYRHLEIYYATSGIGAICHTINPRLPVDQFATSSITPRINMSSSTSPSCPCWRSCRST